MFFFSNMVVKQMSLKEANTTNQNQEKKKNLILDDILFILSALPLGVSVTNGNRLAEGGGGLLPINVPLLALWSSSEAMIHDTND